MTIHIGIDNGVTGSLGIITGETASLHKTPTFSEQSYTKTKQNITRIDTKKLFNLLNFEGGDSPIHLRCLIERPMVNPGRFKATVSAIRALEATIIVLEQLSIPYEYIDSKEWQRALLPKGCEKEELKKAAVDIAKRLFPSVECNGDADGLLIAEYCRRRK